MKSTYRLDTECVVEQLDHVDICRNAAFKLDSPIKIDPLDTLELNDGAWYLISNNVRVPLMGRWISKQ